MVFKFNRDNRIINIELEREAERISVKDIDISPSTIGYVERVLKNGSPISGEQEVTINEMHLFECEYEKLQEDIHYSLVGTGLMFINDETVKGALLKLGDVDFHNLSKIKVDNGVVVIHNVQMMMYSCGEYSANELN